MQILTTFRFGDVELAEANLLQNLLGHVQRRVGS